MTAPGPHSTMACCLPGAGHVEPTAPALAPPDLAAHPLPAAFIHVHGPLAYWARQRPHACALADAHTRLSFAELHAQVETAAERWHAAPPTVLIDAHPDPVARLIEFLSVLVSGRCAAVADPQWPASVRDAVIRRLDAGAPPAQPAHSPLAPFYIGFTSGSTGVPKGFVRHHRSWTESFRVSVADFGPTATGRILAPGRLSHSLFLFGALLGLWTGAGADLQNEFSAGQALRVLQAGQTPVLVAVPSQLLMMLAWAEHRHVAPLHDVRLILISGARWMRDRTPALRALFPQARIVEFYGASETSYIAWMDAHPQAPAQAVGRPFSNVDVHIGPDPDQPALPAGEPGLLWVRSPMLFTDYVGSTDATAAQRAGPWLSVRDVGYRDAAGVLHLSGRENRMLVTQGKNLFPEEVEARLLAHAGVRHASLHGLPDALRGHRVHAVLAWDDASLPLVSAQQLVHWCQAALEPYKAPRHWWRWRGAWPQTPSGKTDHAAIARALAKAVAATASASTSTRTTASNGATTAAPAAPDMTTPLPWPSPRS